MSRGTHVIPTEAALAAFANGEPATPLQGGMGVAWRAGDVVLKPSPGPRQAQLLAKSHANLAETRTCRFQRPVQASTSPESWEIDGWVAWHWIDGETAPERAHEIVPAARTYHSLLKSLPFDPALTGRTDPWACADRVAWGEAQPDYPSEYRAMLAPLLEHAPPSLPSQRIHGDLTGNVVFAPGHAPGIIDPTLYWRPAAFAEAIVLVDQNWFVSTPDLQPFSDTPYLPTMIRRAAARRIAEQPEQVAAHGKDSSDAMSIARQIAQWTNAILEQTGNSTV